MTRLIDLLRPRTALREAADHETPPRDPKTALACHQLELALEQATPELIEHYNPEDMPITIIWQAPEYAARQPDALDVILAPDDQPTPHQCWSATVTEQMYYSLLED